MEETKIKYRVEEHYKNSTTYLLHGIYEKVESARNKKRKLVKSGINADNLFILEITTTTKIKAIF